MPPCNIATYLDGNEKSAHSRCFLLQAQDKPFRFHHISSEKDFYEQIRKEIVGLYLDRDQIILFSRLCAMRAVPFIGAVGNFYFWNRNSGITQHLYAVLNAIDVISSTP